VRLPDPVLRTAEEATPHELRRASLRLFLSLLVLTVLVVPFFRALPLGETTRAGLLAWLMVAVAFYWLYAGLGYRSLLIVQLLLFSTAAVLLTAKALLVGVGVNEFSILRRTARALVVLGAGCGVANLAAMLGALLQQRPPSTRF
jgi:hypothetical protein